MKKNIILGFFLMLFVSGCNLNNNLIQENDNIGSGEIVEPHQDSTNSSIVTWSEELEEVGKLSISDNVLDYAGIFSISLPSWFQSIQITDIGSLVQIKNGQNNNQLMTIYSPTFAQEFDYCDMIADQNYPTNAKTTLQETLIKDGIEIKTYTKDAQQNTFYTPFLTQICFEKDNLGYKIRIYDDSGYAKNIVNSIQLL